MNELTFCLCAVWPVANALVLLYTTYLRDIRTTQRDLRRFPEIQNRGQVYYVKSEQHNLCCQVLIYSVLMTSTAAVMKISIWQVYLHTCSNASSVTLYSVNFCHSIYCCLLLGGATRLVKAGGMYSSWVVLCVGLFYAKLMNQWQPHTLLWTREHTKSIIIGSFMLQFQGPPINCMTLSKK